MKALLLAGGYGTRLSPLSDIFPKCMMPIHGRPLLDIWLDNLLSNHNIERVLINTHAKSNFVNDYLLNSSWKNSIDIVHEDQLLGTAGTILANKSYFDNKEFFVAHADNLSIFNMDSFIKSFNSKSKNIIMTMMLFKCDNPSLCGVVKLNANNEVIEFHEKKNNPDSNLANAAVFIFDTKIFSILEELENDVIDISIDVIPKLINRINCFENTTFHVDIGNILSWNMANIDWPNSDNNFENRDVWKKLLEKNFL
tara:strand:+ start:545 stop:1306 length:762 start_codon:yes stop_codon:yes gene_type:complete